MAEKKLVPATTPGGKTVVVPVVDLDGTAVATGDQKVAAVVPSLTSALAAVDDFTAGLREALKKVAPDKTTVEFSISFAMKAGKIITMFVDGEAEGSVTVTMEWGKD
jgi:hypothetical protein